MAFDLLGMLMAFLDQYGLWAIFILLVLDGAMLIPVLPGEAVMIIAVARYARSIGDLIMLTALVTLAAILGSLLLYGIARAGGRPLVEKHPKLFMMNPRRREKLEAAFEKPLGQSLVLFLRLIPFTRVIVNIPAGVAKMKLGRFIVLSSIGMVIFHAGFMYAAYALGDPSSGLSSQAAGLQEAYANPAWDYIQTNEVVTGIGVLLLGSILSLRGSRRVFKDPDWASTSVIGWLTERVLVFGGLGILAVVWYDPTLLWQYAADGGFDVKGFAVTRGWRPDEFLAFLAGGATLLGLFLMLLSRLARRHKRRHKLEQAMAEKLEEDGGASRVAGGYSFARVDDEEEGTGPGAGSDQGDGSSRPKSGEG